MIRRLPASTCWRRRPLHSPASTSIPPCCGNPRCVSNEKSTKLNGFWSSCQRIGIGPGKTAFIFFRFFLGALPHSLRRVVLFVPLKLHRRPRLVRNLSIGFSPTYSSLRSVPDHDYLFKLPLQGAGCPFTGRRSTAHHYRDRAFPRANRTRVTASTRSRCATSSTSEPPACVPSLPWQCSVAGAWPGVDSGAASPRYNVRRPVPPPPTRNAIRNCLAC